MVTMGTLRRRGNSIVLNIPRAITKELALGNRDIVALAVEGKRLVVVKVDPAELLRAGPLQSPTPAGSPWPKR